MFQGVGEVGHDLPGGAGLRARLGAGDVRDAEQLRLLRGTSSTPGLSTAPGPGTLKVLACSCAHG